MTNRLYCIPFHGNIGPRTLCISHFYNHVSVGGNILQKHTLLYKFLVHIFGLTLPCTSPCQMNTSFPLCYLSSRTFHHSTCSRFALWTGSHLDGWRKGTLGSCRVHHCNSSIGTSSGFLPLRSSCHTRGNFGSPYCRLLHTGLLGSHRNIYPSPVHKWLLLPCYCRLPMTYRSHSCNSSGIVLEQNKDMTLSAATIAD